MSSELNQLKVVDLRDSNTYTSGRFVYRSRPGRWYWQCDLHGDERPQAAWRTFPTMLEAFENALIHAENCPYVTSRNRRMRNNDYS